MSERPPILSIVASIGLEKAEDGTGELAYMLGTTLMMARKNSHTIIYCTHPMAMEIADG